MNDRLYGWKQVAAYLGMSVNWCKKATARGPTATRLPVWKCGGRRVCDVPDLQAWLAGEKARTLGEAQRRKRGELKARKRQEPRTATNSQ